MEEDVWLFTDGSCDPNPGPGRWAALLRAGDKEKLFVGAFRMRHKASYPTKLLRVRLGVRPWFPAELRPPAALHAHFFLNAAFAAAVSSALSRMICLIM